jgi:hypothetical protein
MPVQNCNDSGKPGYKWGDAGKCYIYTSGDNASMKAAKKKAINQGLAIGEVGKFDLIDFFKEEEMINGYPAATQDITINLKNRQYCINVANYGPMNPALPNEDFWQQKADMFKTSTEEAKTALCKNCAAFIQTPEMLDAIAQGLGGEKEAYAIIEIANLGYCDIFDFKCAGNRTCDAWVVGGPITSVKINTKESQ